MADPFLDLEELRVLPDLGNESLYSNDLLEGLVAEFQAIIARHPNGFYGQQTRTISLHPAGRGTVLLPASRSTITALTVDGLAASSGALAGLNVDSIGLVSGGWWVDSPSVTLVATFTTNDQLPPGIKRACGLFVWREAMATVNPNTSNSYLTTNTELQVIERASTADWSATPPRPTGWTDVDKIINQVLSPPIGIA